MSFLNPRNLGLLGLPARLHGLARLPRNGELRLNALPTFPRTAIVLARQRLPLDLQLDDPALHFVDLLGKRVDLDPEPAPRLVHQVDGLVGQEPAPHVPVRQSGGGDQRVISDAHAVVDLVALLDAAQDGDGFLDRGGRDVDRLEAPLQRRVLLDVLAVLAQGGGADDAQVAPREGGLEHVASADRPLGGTRPHDCVQLVDEQDVEPVRLRDLLEDRLHPLLEVAAVLRAGKHGGDVEGHQLPAAERAGDVSRDDALGQPLGDRGLADPRLPDHDRVVLGSPGQDLHHPPDLVVTADHGVQLAAARPLGEIVGVAGQSLVLVLRGLVGDPVGAPDGFERALEPLTRHAVVREDAAGVALSGGESEEEVLGGDVGVAELAGRGLRGAERPVEVARRPRSGSAADRGAPAEFGLQRPGHPLGLGLHLAEHRHHDPALLLQKGLEEMDAVHLRVLHPQRAPGGSGHSFRGLHGHSVRIQHVSIGSCCNSVVKAATLAGFGRAGGPESARMAGGCQNGRNDRHVETRRAARMAGVTVKVAGRAAELAGRPATAALTRPQT